MREQSGRPPADALATLRAKAADVPELEKQCANSLTFLALMLLEADDRPTAAAVLNVAKRRYPRDFWVCHLHGTLYSDGTPDPDAAEAARRAPRP